MNDRPFALDTGLHQMCCLGILLFWLVPGRGLAEQPEYRPGQSYFSRSNYIEYVAGDLPLIISVPHGGALAPSEMPHRTATGEEKDFATVTDANTIELARAISMAIQRDYGHRPHLILCHLKRLKVDCNRELADGAGGNGPARQAWEDFHQYVHVASNTVAARFGRGLYIDLHGQNHPLKRLELGYLLTGAHLTNSDAALNGNGFARRSSLHGLAVRSDIPFAQLLRGTNSLGALLAGDGYPAVPSPAMPSPGNGARSPAYPGDQNSYFSGGYNLRRLCSAGSAGLIDGLQLEANFERVRDTEANRTRFARALARAVDAFLREHYQLSLKSGND